MIKYRILIVEDNNPIRENIKEILELNNYEVVTAANGKEGLLKAIQELPHLILCDIKMPVMDGYHLLEHVKREPVLSNSRFIFLTSACEKKDIEKARLMGADGYIIKPFLVEEMLFTLEKNLLELNPHQEFYHYM